VAPDGNNLQAMLSCQEDGEVGTNYRNNKLAWCSIGARQVLSGCSEAERMMTRTCFPTLPVVNSSFIASDGLLLTRLRSLNDGLLLRYPSYCSPHAICSVATAKRSGTQCAVARMGLSDDVVPSTRRTSRTEVPAFQKSRYARGRKCCQGLWRVVTGQAV
jgi:hypothetical protein